jgi:hypothetical protein
MQRSTLIEFLIVFFIVTGAIFSTVSFYTNELENNIQGRIPMFLSLGGFHLANGLVLSAGYFYAKRRERDRSTEPEHA